MRVLPVPGGLPRERRAVTERLDGLAAITFDFGNTLVPVGRPALRRVVELTADEITRDTPDLDRDRFLAVWAEERDRQFRENVPRFREVDIAERVVRVLARLRGMEPRDESGWDQAAAAALSDPAEVTRAVDAYSAAFIDGMPPRPGVPELLAALRADGFRLGILSNWPLAATVDRYVAAQGWDRDLSAVVVSERVGVIKPHPAIFEAARGALGNPEPAGILHVGDDWAGDIVGASDAGWHTAWVPDRPDDSPLPSSERAAGLEPDLVLADLGELRGSLGPAGPGRRRAESPIG